MTKTKTSGGRGGGGKWKMKNNKNSENRLGAVGIKERKTNPESTLLASISKTLNKNNKTDKAPPGEG